MVGVWIDARRDALLRRGHDSAASVPYRELRNDAVTKRRFGAFATQPHSSTSSSTPLWGTHPIEMNDDPRTRSGTRPEAQPRASRGRTARGASQRTPSGKRCKQSAIVGEVVYWNHGGGASKFRSWRGAG